MPNTNFDILFEACRRANILDINIGLESGSERIRKNILKRDYSNYDFIKTINLAKKYKLNYIFHVMIGIPGETAEDVKETIKICRICQPKYIFLSIFYPYPGTDLYKLCEKMDLLKERTDTKMERRQAIMNLPGFNKKQIQRSYIWFNYNVYKGYKSRVKLMLRVIMNFLSSNYFITGLFTKLFRLNLIIRLGKYTK